MSLGHAMRRAAAGVSTDDGFFGAISMLREFWAEDPSWTNPGDGNDMVTWRDNGSLAEDVTAETLGGGAGPTYTASGINSKPAVRFNGTTSAVGGRLYTASGAHPAGSTGVTIVAVAKLDVTGTSRYITDGWSSASNRGILGALSADWRLYGSSGLFIGAGTPDTADHLFVGKLKDNDAELWIDGASIGTDTSGTISGYTGFIIGAARGAASAVLDGDVSYVSVYSGDLTAHGDYAAYTTAITDYYGI